MILLGQRHTTPCPPTLSFGTFLQMLLLPIYCRCLVFYLSFTPKKFHFCSLSSMSDCHIRNAYDMTSPKAHIVFCQAGLSARQRSPSLASCKPLEIQACRARLMATTKMAVHVGYSDHVLANIICTCEM